MPQILAVCDECGHFFQSGYGIDAGGTGLAINYTVQSVPRTCPRCGGAGHMLGGTYHVVEDTIELLQGPERTVSELERLREILREARQSGANAEEVSSAVQREFPEWGQALAGLLVPKTPADLYALLAVVLMALEMILGDKQTGQTVNIEADQIINNITVVQEAAPVPGQPQVTPSANPAHGEKIGRNGPCPCGRDLKFKKCHGKNGEKRYYGP
jgi:hypothetical protein